MPFALYPSLFFTVVLLVTTTYFLLGGLPLLTLKHDVPLDARFIRSFFRVYYQAAFWAAVGAALSYGLWGRFGYATGAAALALIAVAFRRRVLPAMERLGSEIEQRPQEAVRAFRRVHAGALGANFLQLVVLVWGVIHLSITG